jgi:hypothetical protein
MYFQQSIKFYLVCWIITSNYFNIDCRLLLGHSMNLSPNKVLLAAWSFMIALMNVFYIRGIIMANWLDGYAVLTGKIDDILMFVTTSTMNQSEPVHALLEGSEIIFPNNFIPEDLYVLNSTRIFIGFCHKHDIKETNAPNRYKVSVTWDKAHGLITEELPNLAKAK